MLVESFTDGEQNRSFIYKQGNLTVAVVDNLDNRTTYRYNAFGSPVLITDPRGNNKTLRYDTQGYKIAEISALGSTTLFEYDENGNLVFEKNAVGTIKTAYDSMDKPVRKEYSDGNIKSFSYDSLERLSQVSDMSSSYAYGYDDANMLVSKKDLKTGAVQTHRYDPNGNRILLEAEGRKVLSTYNVLNLVSSESVLKDGKTNLQIAYRYNSMGRLTNKIFSSGLTTAYQYDALYRVTSILYATNQQIVSSFAYQYDRVGNKTQEAVQNGLSNTQVSAFIYDKSYRLIEATYGNDGVERFKYDASGNRLEKWSSLEKTKEGKPLEKVTHCIYDNDNRLMSEQTTSATPGNPTASDTKQIRYSYDGAGRLIKRESALESEYLKYNQRDLLVQRKVVRGGKTEQTDFTYDVDNLRTQKKEIAGAPGTFDSVPARFVYDGGNLLTKGGRFYLNNGGLNGYEAEISESVIALFIKDTLGTIRAELYDRPFSVNGSTRSLFRLFSYTAFGEQLNPEKAREGISFTGHFYDKESKLYYAKARYLDPNIGRFITMDPIQDPAKRYSPAGLNYYVYCINNPLNYTDLKGEWFGIDDLIKVVIGGVIGAVNGFFNFLDSGNPFDIILGSISGAATWLLNGNGIPIYIDITTSSFSFGFGYTFSILNVGAGITIGYDERGIRSAGMNANMGLKFGPVGVGLSAGIMSDNYNGFSSNVGASLSFGTTNGAQSSRLNLGMNAQFDRDGFSGFGLNMGVQANYGNAVGINGFGINGGLNFDKNGNFTGNSMGFHFTGGRVGEKVVEKGSIGETYHYLYSEQYGMNVSFGKDGSVRLSANSSVIRQKELYYRFTPQKEIPPVQEQKLAVTEGTSGIIAQVSQSELESFKPSLLVDPSGVQKKDEPALLTLDSQAGLKKKMDDFQSEFVGAVNKEGDPVGLSLLYAGLVFNMFGQTKNSDFALKMGETGKFNTIYHKLFDDRDDKMAFLVTILGGTALAYGGFSIFDYFSEQFSMSSVGDIFGGNIFARTIFGSQTDPSVYSININASEVSLDTPIYPSFMARAGYKWGDKIFLDTNFKIYDSTRGDSWLISPSLSWSDINGTNDLKFSVAATNDFGIKYSGYIGLNNENRFITGIKVETNRVNVAFDLNSTKSATLTSSIKFSDTFTFSVGGLQDYINPINSNITLIWNFKLR